MKYKITMRKSYSEIEFIYKSITEAGAFIREALVHSNGDISFTVEAITEEESTETITEEEGNTDEE